MENGNYAIIYCGDLIALFDTFKQAKEFYLECMKEDSIYIKKDNLFIFSKLD